MGQDRARGKTTGGEIKEKGEVGERERRRGGLSISE